VTKESALAPLDIGNPRPLFTDLVIPAITVFRGRFVETMRDDMLVEFASIIDEVRCAVANPR
jgi:class 3 adenylate cyclase